MLGTFFLHSFSLHPGGVGRISPDKRCTVTLSVHLSVHLSVLPFPPSFLLPSIHLSIHFFFIQCLLSICSEPGTFLSPRDRSLGTDQDRTLGAFSCQRSIFPASSLFPGDGQGESGRWGMPRVAWGVCVALRAIVFNFISVRDNKRSKTSSGRKTRTFIQFERKTHVVGKSGLICALRSRTRCKKGNRWTLHGFSRNN